MQVTLKVIMIMKKKVSKTSVQRITWKIKLLWFISCLLELAKINIPFACQSCKTEVSIKMLKTGSAIVFKWVSEEL